MSRGKQKSQRATQGFTLIEVLVALLILGIMSALGYGTYRAARISAERTEESLKRSREIEFGMRVIAQDFAQIVPRPVRDPLGQSRLPALRGTGGAGTVSSPTTSTGIGSSSGSSTYSGMSFNSNAGFGAVNTPTLGSISGSSLTSIADLTRMGWSNTAGQQRSSLQRVSYALVDDVLKRSYTTNLDTVQGTTPVVQDLFTGVKGIQFRYLDGNQTWQNLWPPPGMQLPDSTFTRPVAVEIVIEFKDWGRIRRLIEVPG